VTRPGFSARERSGKDGPGVGHARLARPPNPTPLEGPVRPTKKKLLALSAALSLALAACGQDDVATPAVSGEAAAVEETTTTTTEAPSAAPTDASVDDPASTLRSTLTSLLQEHVYLAGFALQSVLEVGADDPATQAALDALDENTVALGDVVGTIPGVDDPTEFVELWRDHIGYFADYAVGRAEGDDEAMDQALADLEEYQQATADLLESATEGELLADDVFGELQSHVDMVTAVIDTAAGEGEEGADPFELLRDAAGHMDGVALAIADAVVSAHEDDIPGDPNSVPAETRAELTSALQEQVYLAVLAGAQLAEAGSATDPAVQSAESLLQGASEDLANTVGGATGTAERAAFNGAWRPHLDALLGYAEARTTGTDADAQAARAELDAAADAAAAALSQLAGGADVAALVDSHVQTATAAIDALAAGDPGAPSLARAAAQVMPELAATLAGGIVSVSTAEDAAEGQGTEGGGEQDGAGGTATDAAAEGSSDAGTAEGGGTGGETGTATEEDPEPPTSPSDDASPDAEGGR